MFRSSAIRCSSLFLGALLWNSALAANDWEDPEIVGRNKLAPTATMFRFDTPEQAMAGGRDESPYVKLLAGDWKFKYVATPEERPGTSTRRTLLTLIGTTSKCRPIGNVKALVNRSIQT